LTRRRPAARRAAWLIALGLCCAATPGAAQRLLYGRWQTQLDESGVTLVVIAIGDDGWMHGTLFYAPPYNGFAGAPFTTQIKDGAFTIALADGTRYADMHWCGAELCGRFYLPDDTMTPVVFARPTD